MRIARRGKAVYLCSRNMQILKDDTRRRILTQSRKLFLEKGFRDTTTRDIAQASGAVLSSLYRYFSSKDDLFLYIVKPAMSALEDMLERHHNPGRNDIAAIRSDRFAEDALEEYLTIIERHRETLKILLLRADGSTLENYKEYYVNKSTGMVMEWFSTMKARYPGMNTQVSEFFIHLNNVWMFTLLEEILMHDLPEDETRSVLSDYIQFEFTGWMKMMKV